MTVAANKRVLVTGAGGYLGREVSCALRHAGYQVSGVGHGRAPADAGLLSWCEADVGSESVREAITQGGVPSVVVHAAGGASVRTAQEAPHGDFERTVASTAGVLEALRRLAPNTRLVMVSSAAVYGNGHDKSIRETSELDPISHYGVHKRLAEELCLAAVQHWNLDLVIVRFFSIYGAGLRKQIFWDLAERCRTGARRIALSGTGAETRDFLHVADAARFLVKMADGARRNVPLVLNGGTGRATTIRQAAQTLVRAWENGVQVVFDGQIRPGDPEHLVADIGRLAATGFQPEVTLEAGLREYANWYGAHRHPGRRADEASCDVVRRVHR